MNNKSLHTFIRPFIFLVISVTLLGYGYTRINPYLTGPDIVITEPSNGILVQTSPIVFQGTATRITSLHLNGRKIFVDQNGSFTEEIFLHPGHNIITIEAIDRFEQRVEKQFQIRYHET